MNQSFMFPSFLFHPTSVQSLLFVLSTACLHHSFHPFLLTKALGYNHSVEFSVTIEFFTTINDDVFYQ